MDIDTLCLFTTLACLAKTFRQNPQKRHFQSTKSVGCSLYPKRLLTALAFFFWQAKGVRIVAIGVGNYRSFEGQLEEIAGEKVYNATNFDQLSDLFSEILKETCSK